VGCGAVLTARREPLDIKAPEDAAHLMPSRVRRLSVGQAADAEDTASGPPLDEQEGTVAALDDSVTVAFLHVFGITGDSTFGARARVWGGPQVVFPVVLHARCASVERDGLIRRTGPLGPTMSASPHRPPLRGRAHLLVATDTPDVNGDRARSQRTHAPPWRHMRGPALSFR